MGALLGLRAAARRTGPALPSACQATAACLNAGPAAEEMRSMRWFSARVPEGFVALNNIADNPGATKAVRVVTLAMGRLAGYPLSH